MIFKKLLRLVAFVLVLSMLFAVSLVLTSCEAPDDSSDDKDDDKTGESSYLDKVIFPEYKDYERDTINFSDITYSRPDINALINVTKELTEVVLANSISYDEQLTRIKEFDKSVENLLTMRTLSSIHLARDSSVEFWNEENSYITTNMSSFSLELEKLLVACARSSHAQRFEDEFFGDGFIEEYADGTTLTEELISLIKDEAELVSQYNALSTESVVINYNGTEDTVNNILAYYENKYGKSSSEYTSISTVVMKLYQETYNSLSKNILIELVKIRRLIADADGQKNYIHYKLKSDDYTPEQISSFISGISAYVLPVYIQLYSYVFYYYFLENQAPEVSFDQVINNVGSTVKDIDEGYYEIYSYMLQHKLFDIDKVADNRQVGAFTSYLNKYNAPFIFISGNENIDDYSTLLHEFGHFIDMYKNDGDLSVIDIAEIFSQALELLSLPTLSKYIGEEYKTYLTYSALKDSLEALVYQGFYARIEEGMYKLEFNQINESSINEIVIDAAEEFMINTSAVYKIEHVLIPHFLQSPIYVHSYCTSVIPALEIYFMEKENIGSGFDAYERMVERGGEEISFLELLERADLTSPFENGHLKDIADKIHYEVLGSHYYQESVPIKPAA